MASSQLLHRLRNEFRVILAVSIASIAVLSLFIGYWNFKAIKQEMVSTLEAHIRSVVARAQTSGSLVFLQRDLEALILPYARQYPAQIKISDSKGFLLAEIKNPSTEFFRSTIHGSVNAEVSVITDSLNYDLVIGIDNLIIQIFIQLFGYYALFVATIWAAVRMMERQTAREIDPLVQLSAYLDNLNISDDNKIVASESLKFPGAETQKLVVILQKFNQLADELANSAADRKVGLITRQVAHDLRSPLSALNMSIAHISKLNPEVFSLIKASIERIENIANDVLKSHKPDSKTNIANLSEIIGTIASEKRALYSHSTISCELPVDRLIVNIPNLTLSRIISNLLNNALEASERPKVVISAKDIGGRQVQVDIRDNGVGISPEQIRKIEAREYFTSKKEGSGLGLRHAITEIENYGGQLKVASEVGIGSTVSITLSLKTQ